jgi:2-isopropylmalate synthase
VIGADAFRTATGVHAAAVVKAGRKEDPTLVDAVYAAVPARLVGRGQVIDIGPMSGRSNVIYWLESRGLTASEEVVDRIVRVAKGSDHTLAEGEVLAILGQPDR